MKRKLRLKLGIVGLTVIMAISGCSSESAPVESKPKVSGVLGEVGGEENPANSAGTATNPLVTNLNEKLQGLGYEALGLQFESDETLLLIGKVFDSAISHDRQIKIIYTGLEMSYDAKHQSLTLGGTKTLSAILSFINKNIPKRNTTESEDIASPAWMTTPNSVESQSSSIEAGATTAGVTTTTLSPQLPKTPKIRPEGRNNIRNSKKRVQIKKGRGKNLGVKPPQKTVPEMKKAVVPKPPVTTTLPPQSDESNQPTVTTPPSSVPETQEELSVPAPTPAENQPLLPEPDSEAEPSSESSTPSEI